MYRIKIDRNRCIGCLTCVAACVVTHEAESGDARNRVAIDRDTKLTPVFCKHCNRPECVYTCTTGAMNKNFSSGYVEYNAERCSGCYMCIMSCPYGVLKYDSIKKKKILKCNMCTHRSKDARGNPMCVEQCPMFAISVEEIAT